MNEINSWKIVRTSGISGTGSWLKFDMPLSIVEKAASNWRQQTRHVDRPWLCWNINDAWCLVQQKIVKDVGWTPIVGWDPNCGVTVPPLVEGAVAIDFNEGLGLPVLWPHVPMEFAFLWCEKLAFWHADLLVPIPKLQEIVNVFDCLNDGEMAAVLDYGGIRRFWKYRSHRYWELLGCTTRGASRSLFENGCGWWRHFWAHPNCPDHKERRRRIKYYYDQGVGIMYWKRNYSGKVYSLNLRSLAPGHFSKIGNKNYLNGVSKSQELDMNFNLEKAAKSLGLEKYIS